MIGGPFKGSHASCRWTNCATAMDYEIEPKRREDLKIHEVNADSMDEIDTFAEAVE